MIKHIESSDFELSLTGSEKTKLPTFLRKTKEIKLRMIFDITAILEKASIVERFSIGAVGRHRLIFGDVIIDEDGTKLINGRQADLITINTLYKISLKSANYLKIQNNSMISKNF